MTAMANIKATMPMPNIKAMTPTIRTTDAVTMTNMITINNSNTVEKDTTMNRECICIFD